jgi:CubicO group peptidase (beta-lactamase class C family)
MSRISCHLPLRYFLSYAVVLAATIFIGAHANATNQTSQLSELLQDAVAKRSFSGAVLVTENDIVLLKGGYGMANVELQVPNTPATKFRIGSVTKQFTAMAVLILAEQGKLKLDDRVVDLLPGLPRAWADIRVYQLLNHTSGIMHSWEIPGFTKKVMTPWPLNSMIDEIKDRPLLFRPGTDVHYSGIGYFLLARIVERVSGQTYEIFLKDAIFDPLGMKDTGGDSDLPIIPGRAAGYVHMDGQLQNAPFIYMPNLTGGGNLYSTVEDLARWDHALTTGRLISSRSYEKMFTAGREGFGYGWKISQVGGHTVIEHSGGVNGFAAHIRRVPDRKIGIFILSNDEATGHYLTAMAEEIERIVLEDN